MKLLQTAISSRRTLFCQLILGAAGFGIATNAGALVQSAASLNDAEWLRRLGAARFRVLRQAATEAPFSSKLTNEHRVGTFFCAGCALPLFASSAKFDSGTGWPSFFAHLPGSVTTTADHSLFMERTEVRCRRCDGHLGHVFNDGPRPTGLRYCINGLALEFKPIGTA